GRSVSVCGLVSNNMNVPKWRHRFSGSTSIHCVLAFVAMAGLLPAADADLILRNGKIVMVDKSFTIQQAVAVKGGKISAVGSDASILQAERGPNTRVIDLNGK